jgi:competence protein ComEC
MIVAFIAVTGSSPIMSRAGLVAGLSLAAWYYGRRFHPLVLLPFVAAITLIIQPSYAWGDLGWSLSFMAFAGVMMIAPLLQRYFFGDKKPNIVRQILGETIAAHIITAPLIIMSFGYISHVAILANLLILLFVPLAMLLTFIAGIGALLLPQIASVIGLPAQWLLTYMTTTTHYLADLPWAQSEIQLSPIFIVIFYLVIIGIGVYMWRATKLDLRDTNLIE